MLFPVADPWVVLGALAVRTRRCRIGPMVTPLARRRPEKVAREAVTVDRLSGGRLVLGVGLPGPAGGTIPVWAACTTPHRAPLRRAARLDGVVLANTTPKGGIEPVPAAGVHAAADQVRRQRGDLDGFDVAVLCPAMPAKPELADYAEAGATWTVVTGWVDQLRVAIAEGPPG